MTPILMAFLVSLAGGVGAAARFLVDTAIPAGIRERFPWGTFLINMSGSLALGLIAGPLSATAWGPIFTVGLLGGYTTFSAASLETVSLFEDGRRARAFVYGVGSVALSVAAAALGVAITR